jgi:hypothetical protein
MDLEVGALVDADRDHHGGVQDGERTERPALAAGQSAQAGVLRESGDEARPGGRVTSCNGAGKDSSARPLFKARTSRATGAALPGLAEERDWLIAEAEATRFGILLALEVMRGVDA